MNGKLITLEGISGMGKTYYFNKLKELYNNGEIIFNSEINDSRLKGNSQRIFKILYQTKSRFFDLGNPKFETLLIAAKQANDEDYMKKYYENGSVVLSDRGFDTVCILEGIMFYKKYGGDINTYIDMLYDSLKNFNRVPDLTFLFIGNKDLSIKRAIKRDGFKYSDEELFILNTLYEKYLEYSLINSDRFIIVNVDEGEDKVVRKLSKVLNKVI